MNNIVVIQVRDEELINEIKLLCKNNVTELETKDFDGNGDVISLLVVIIPFIVKELSKILVSSIEAKKNIHILHNGTEISGLSKNEMIAMLEKIAEMNNDCKRKEP